MSVVLFVLIWLISTFAAASSASSREWDMVVWWGLTSIAAAISAATSVMVYALDKEDGK